MRKSGRTDSSDRGSGSKAKQSEKPRLSQTIQTRPAVTSWGLIYYATPTIGGLETDVNSTGDCVRL